MVAPCHCHTIFERTGRERGSCNKLRLARGRRNICQRGERASHKGELIKRLNFQEWPFVRVRKAIEISVLSRLTSSIPPPRSIFHRQRTEVGTSEGQDERTERGFHARQYKGTVAPPLPHLISPEGPETMRNLLKLISNSFQKKWARRRRGDRSSGHPASATRRRCTQYLKGTHN